MELHLDQHALLVMNLFGWHALANTFVKNVRWFVQRRHGFHAITYVAVFFVVVIITAQRLVMP